jgi:hypothetical protein
MERGGGGAASYICFSMFISAVCVAFYVCCSVYKNFPLRYAQKKTNCVSVNARFVNFINFVFMSKLMIF